MPGSVTGPSEGAEPTRLRTLAHAWGPTAIVAAACVVVLFAWQAAFYVEHHPVIDHVAYTEQAEQLLDRGLTMPTDERAPSWAVRFTVETDDGRVFKYLPGTAAIGAVSLALTGEVGVALAASLVVLVIATSGVAAVLGWSPGHRALAAALVGLSPVVLSNSTVLLSYVPATALAVTGAWLVLRATVRPSDPGPADTDPAPPDLPGAPVPTTVGRRTRHRLLAGGLVLGAALLVRQLEVVAWIAVVGAWLALRPGLARPDRLRQTAAFATGLVPGVLAVLVLNQLITGHVLEFPFTLVSPDDGLGWGWRRVLPDDALERFVAADAARTTPRALFDLAMWTLAGPALVVGAAIATWARRRSPAHLLLAGLGASIPLVFVAHWANAHAVRGGFYMTAGPFYLLPCVVPLVLLGVDGLRRLPRNALLVGVALALVVQAAFLTEHLWDQWGGGDPVPNPPVAAAAARPAADPPPG